MIYQCPECSTHALVWDARCKVFLCLNRTCSKVVRPPDEEGIAIQITTGRVSVTQDWINTR